MPCSLFCFVFFRLFCVHCILLVYSGLPPSFQYILLLTDQKKKKKNLHPIHTTLQLIYNPTDTKIPVKNLCYQHYTNLPKTIKHSKNWFSSYEQRESHIQTLPYSFLSTRFKISIEGLLIKFSCVFYPHELEALAHRQKENPIGTHYSQKKILKQPSSSTMNQQVIYHLLFLFTKETLVCKQSTPSFS